MESIHFHRYYKALGENRPENFLGCGATKVSNNETVTQINLNIKYAFVIVILLDGEGEFTDHFGHTHILKRGSGFQRIPNLNHKFVLKPQSNYEEMWLHIPKSYYEFIRPYGFNFESIPVFQLSIDKTLINQFNELICEIRDKNGFELTDVLFKISRLAFKILSQFQTNSQQSYHNKILDEACELIKSDLYSNSNLPLLLSKMEISYERIRKIFKDHLGLSPGAYRIQQRIHVGQQLLLTRLHTVGGVANQLGYADSFTFSKQFKQQTGVSPEAFLKSFFNQDIKHLI